MPSLTQCAPKIATLAIEGASYPLPQFTLRELAALQTWLDATHPGPASALKGTRLDGLPDDVRRALVADVLAAARTYSPPRLGTIEADDALATPGALCEMLRLMLAKGTPALAKDAIEAIVGSVTLNGETMAFLRAAALGGAATDRPEGEVGPKGEAGDPPSPP